MKLFYVLLATLTFLFADTNSSSKYDIVPTITSNPTSGTGVGVLNSFVYGMDHNGSPSQATLTAEYTTSNSFNVFFTNTMFLASDKVLANTSVTYVYTKNDFDVNNTSTQFDLQVIYLAQEIQYAFIPNFYTGVKIAYVKVDFEPTNSAGTAFLLDNGITNDSRANVGLSFLYDNRNKNEKIYPRDAQYLYLGINAYPSFLGAAEDFYVSELNAKHYQRGFKATDVIALQLYVQYGSENTSDPALPGLGFYNILRGFPNDQYKARLLSAIQTEYRYQINESRYRLTAFAGFANLSLGSKGTASGNRDSNNGNYYSGGMGIHYILNEKLGVDYRVDLVSASTGEYSVYANINQAF